MLSVAVILIVVEASINCYLFSAGNEFVLFGGLIAATLVWAINVGGSMFLGFMARYVPLLAAR